MYLYQSLYVYHFTANVAHMSRRKIVKHVFLSVSLLSVFIARHHFPVFIIFFKICDGYYESIRMVLAIVFDGFNYSLL